MEVFPRGLFAVFGGTLRTDSYALLTVRFAACLTTIRPSECGCTLLQRSGRAGVRRQESHDSIGHVIGGIGRPDNQQRMGGMIDRVGQCSPELRGAVQAMIGYQDQAIDPFGFEEGKGDDIGS
jgi:hypothetical protein